MIEARKRDDDASNNKVYVYTYLDTETGRIAAQRMAEIILTLNFLNVASALANLPSCLEAWQRMLSSCHFSVDNHTRTVRPMRGHEALIL